MRSPLTVSRRGAPLLAALFPLVAACNGAPGAAPPAVPGQSAAAAPGVCALLTVNDTYRIEPSPDGTGGMARLRALRARLQARYPDLIVLHAGDLLFPSLLSREYQGAQMVDVLNNLDGSPAFDPRLIVTFGNHEFDADKPAILSSRLRESAFRWVSSNIKFKPGPDGAPLVAAQKIAEDVILSCGGRSVGVFGLTTDEKKPPYIAEYANPIEVARARTAALRARGADIVVGLTHLSIDADAALLARLGPAGPDLIAGGHEHARQTRSAATGRPAAGSGDDHSVYKADSDAHTANLLRVTKGPEGVKVEHEWLELGPSDPPPDPVMEAVVSGWLDKHERAYCEKKMKLSPGCLGERLGVAGVDLIGEELEIRRFETNLGDYVLDRQLATYEKQGAQIAFLNAGALRFNDNIVKGAPITRRTIEELFAYPTHLRLIEITGETLQKVLERATTAWTGQGHFLQIAGFAYRFDPKSGKISGITLLRPSPRAVLPGDRIKAVVNSFLLDPARGRDGYTMIGPQNIIDAHGPEIGVGPELKQIIIDAIKSAGPGGIAPAIDGRICNTERPGPCLAR